MKKLTNKNHTSHHTHHTTQKGITLVALVITIIVLLILAGVAINMAINSDGLFGKANEAVEQYEQSRKNESFAISDLESIFTELETGVKIEEVIDEKPGELELDGEIFVINSIEDLVFFSYDVRQGNTYEGKTVKLGLNLDFNSSKSYVDALRKDYGKYGYNGELKTLLTTGEGFKPIGDYYNAQTNNFKGTFDGNNKIICNLYININKNDGYIRLGLFGRNDGTIKKLGLESINITAVGLVSNVSIGSIAGQTSKTATIEKCYASGNVTASALNIGGIIAICSGTVKDCYSGVNIANNVSEEISETIKIGGIVSGLSSTETVSVSNCYNTGKIQHTSIVANVEIGGIAGRIQETTSNCYNVGDIIVSSKNATNLRVGGIGGYLLSTVDNCHSKGKMAITSENVESARYGAIVGYLYNTTVTNCSYLSSIAERGVGLGDDTTTPVENEANMASILSVVGEAYKLNPKNTEYPILDWQ